MKMIKKITIALISFFWKSIFFTRITRQRFFPTLQRDELWYVIKAIVANHTDHGEIKIIRLDLVSTIPHLALINHSLSSGRLFKGIKIPTVDYVCEKINEKNSSVEKPRGWKE